VDAPSDELRMHVTRMLEDGSLEGGPDGAAEEALEAVLARIEADMDKSLGDESPHEELSEEAGEDQLAVIDAWAALISHAVARAYAPASPWPSRRAGWSGRIVKRLRRMAGKLRKPLGKVVKALKAVSASISVSFPWGISVGVSF
jgi:hypothetical protein